MNSKYTKTELTQEYLNFFLNRLSQQKMIDKYYEENNAKVMQRIEKEQLKQMEKQIYKEIEKLLDGFNKK